MSKNIPETPVEQEEWRVVPGLIYSGFYEASSLGRIKDNVSGVITKGNPGTYYTYRLKGVNKSFFVHRLVATAFLGLPSDPKLVVNHIDLNKHNNRIANLEWVTQSRNVQHAKDHYHNATPEAIQQRKQQIINLRKAGWGYAEIGKQFSMTKDQVRAAIMASGLQTEDDRCEYIVLNTVIRWSVFDERNEEFFDTYAITPKRKS